MDQSPQPESKDEVVILLLKINLVQACDKTHTI